MRREPNGRRRPAAFRSVSTSFAADLTVMPELLAQKIVT